MNRPDVYDELSTTRDMQQKSLYIKRLYFCLYSIMYNKHKYARRESNE